MVLILSLLLSVNNSTDDSNDLLFLFFGHGLHHAGNDPDVVFNTARFFTGYSPNRNFSKQLYARFEKLASGREKYTAELEEARAEISR